MWLPGQEPAITILNSLILVPDSVPGQMIQATVRGLSPWVDHEFRVVAVNGVGVGEPSTHTKPIRTKAAGTLSFPRFTFRVYSCFFSCLLPVWTVFTRRDCETLTLFCFLCTDLDGNTLNALLTDLMLFWWNHQRTGFLLGRTHAADTLVPVV